MNTASTSHPGAGFWRDGPCWAGFAGGPALWAVALELNYAITGWQCSAHVRPAPLIALLGAAGAALCGLVSYNAWKGAGGPPPPESIRTRRFVAAVSAGMAALFALILVLQALAGVFLDGCET